MPVAVPIVAGTAIKGIAATLMMRRVLERHPNAFLITLASFGVTIPLHKSQHHLAADIRRGLLEQDRAPDSPVVLVGHSQGALASLRYAIDHPDQVLYVFSVGAPWHGSRSAARVAGLARRTGRNITPALTDMAAGSQFLRDLHADLPRIADRVTNIYTTREIVISPYFHAHIDIAGVQNILIAPQKEYLRHLQTFPEYPLEGHIEAKVTHLGEMSNAEVRSLIWTKVDQITARVRRGELGPGARPRTAADQDS